MLEILTMVLGPVVTNTYLIADPDTHEAAVIDPAWEGKTIFKAASQRGWDIRQIWVTHAHFDHIGGVAELARACNPPPVIGLHPADLPIWQAQGGAALFGMRIEPPPEPTLQFQHQQVLRLRSYEFEVRHVPGHSPGHVVFYCAAQGVVFDGDTLFWGGIGRTDLPGGDYETLIEAIRAQLLSLPDETRVLSGHGEETSIGQERRWNAFLA